MGNTVSGLLVLRAVALWARMSCADDMIGLMTGWKDSVRSGNNWQGNGRQSKMVLIYQST